MSLARRIRKLEDRLRPPVVAPPTEEIRAALRRRFARMDVEIGTCPDGVVPDVLVGDTPEQRRRDAEIERRWWEASGVTRIRRDPVEVEALRDRVRQMFSLPPQTEAQKVSDSPSS